MYSTDLEPDPNDLAEVAAQTAAEIAELTRKINENPDSFESYLERGRVRVNLTDDLDEAIADFSMAIQLRPNDPAGYIGRGDVHKRAHNSAAAMADYAIAIQIDPNSAEAYGHRALLRMDLEDYENAILDWSQAIALDPTDSGSFYCRAGCYQRLGRYNEAIPDYNSAVELEPHSDVYRFRAENYRQMGNFAAAIADYIEAINRDDGADVSFPWWYSYEIGAIYAQMGDIENALLYFRQTLDNGRRIDPEKVSEMQQYIAAHGG